MRLALLSTLVCGLAMAACTQEVGEATEPTSANELGLEMSSFQEDLVVGKLTTQSGIVTFRATKQADGVFKVQFDRGHGTFGTTVDWNTYEFDLEASAEMEITKEDRFVMTALESTLDASIKNDLQIADNLIRQTRLWAAHPIQKAITGHQKADPNRGWTTLCLSNGCRPNSSYRYFYHSGSGTDYASCGGGSHAGTSRSNYLQYGQAQSTTGASCRSRCGAGCTSVGTSAWTQDCGNHDACEWYHTGDCGGEWTSASDDFSFAGNCNNC